MSLTKPNQTESIPAKQRKPGDPLANFLHERFAQALHLKLWSGEKQAEARVSAYRETLYRGSNPDDRSLKPNSRRLCQRTDVRTRLSELAERSATLAAIEAGWIIMQNKALLDEIDRWNVDDFLAAPDKAGGRRIDISRATREQLALLTELAIEPSKYGTKIKIKGPDRYTAKPAILALIARVGGHEAPKKISPTDAAGNDLSLSDLVGASMALVLERRQSAAKVA